MHGTGHGIGAYLNVHEGPMGISWREIPNDPGLQAGMFLSNGNMLSKYYLCPAKCLIHELYHPKNNYVFNFVHLIKYIHELC